MFFSWRPIKNDSVTPYVSFDKNDSVTPHVSFDKNDSVTPCVFFHDDQRKTTVSPPMFYLINIDSVTPYIYFMTADKKRQLPLMFFPCWPIKNDSVNPHVSFDENDSITPYVLMDKYRQCYPLCFFHDDW